MAAHWLELHNNSYLAGIDATNDPFTMVNDSPRWGYHGAQIAHFLAGGDDRMVRPRRRRPVRNAGESARLRARQRRHRGHDDQRQPQHGRDVTVNVTGGTLALRGQALRLHAGQHRSGRHRDGRLDLREHGRTAVTVLVPEVLVGRRRVPEALVAGARRAGPDLSLPAGGGVE